MDQKVRAKGELAVSIREDARRFFIRRLMMNIMERPQACGCTVSECDDLTCGSVVRTIAQDHSVDDHYTVEQAPGNCIEVQAAPKVHYSNKSSGPGHG